MKKSRFTAEQIAYALWLAEGGTPMADVCRHRLLRESPEQALEEAEIVVVGAADAATRSAIIERATGRRIIDLSGYAELRTAGAAR